MKVLCEQIIIVKINKTEGSINSGASRESGAPVVRPMCNGPGCARQFIFHATGQLITSAANTAAWKCHGDASNFETCIAVFSAFTVVAAVLVFVICWDYWWFIVCKLDIRPTAYRYYDIVNAKPMHFSNDGGFTPLRRRR